MKSSLLVSKEFTASIGSNLSGASCTILSAYVTRPAVQWLTDSQLRDIRLVCRMSPRDFTDRSTDLEALDAVLAMGWKLYCLPNLHAKVYLIDGLVYIGSANLTASGLALSSNYNLEVMFECEADNEVCETVNRLVREAIPIYSDTLDEMREFVSTYETRPPSDVPNQWPRTILPTQDILLVTDFPLAPPGHPCAAYDLDPELPFAKLEFWCSSAREKASRLKQTKSYNWLISTLQSSSSNELYFGNLSAQLHASLSDDPKPYRKDVKQLVANLVEYASCYCPDEIMVDQPRYSTRISLCDGKSFSN